MAEVAHLRATVLPDGTEPRDLWIVDGALTWNDPGQPAIEWAPEGGFVSPPLVDGHVHIDFSHEPGQRPPTETLRRAAARAGILYLRDMGASSDDLLKAIDRPGLASVQACGRVFVRFDQYPFEATQPEALPDAVEAHARRGARWIKIFADWTDDYGGAMNTGFTGQDAVTYDLDCLTEAVERAHAAGSRVAAHAFTREGAAVAIGAGVDSIEHGWGLDAELIDQMGDTTWLPLLGIAVEMRQIAERDQEPDRVRWVDEALETLSQTLPLARDRGVRIVTGTDWFPGFTAATEALELVRHGLSATDALRAATVAGLDFLGAPGLDEGAPASLVWFEHDPREQLERLQLPSRVLHLGVPLVPARVPHEV